jgi:hypothetical protein
MGVRQYAFIIVVGLPAIGFLVAYPLTKTTNITIGKETTIITKPLADDGYPDYLTALNQNGSEAVTSDRNAAVHFCRALGSNWLPAAERRAYFEMLGINPPS